MVISEPEQHKKFLRQAIEIARQNVASGRGGPFGAVIVKDGQIIAQAGNEVLAENDPTLHAEVNAIRRACKKLNTFELKDCVIYSSCEPCPMCLGAVYWARPKALYFAAERHCAARYNFDDEYIYKELVLPLEKRHIPTVCVKLAEAEEPFKKWDEKEDKISY